jgi:uncharacterized damage-inducible protein DinB
MDRSLVVPSLEATPFLLWALCEDCTPEQGWTPPRPGEWSIAETVRHLVEGDRDTFLPRLRRMVSEDRPVFESRPAARGDASDLATLLGAFESARREAARILRSLDAAGWRRVGVSPSRGPVTIEDYARTMAEHDTEHLRQIHGVRQQLDLLPKRAESRQALPVAEIVAAIRPAPERLRRLAAGVTAAQLRQRPRHGEWGMKEVMAHLLKVERDVFLPRLRRIVSEDRPGFERFDPDTWAAESDHREGDFEEDLRGFAAARGRTVAFLESLPAGAAERIGFSAVFGPVTLGQYATHIVDHDAEHLAQMTACRAAMAGAGSGS